MTAQEQELIDGLVERIRNTQVADKDLAAEQHLQQGLAGYPDAVYVLAQTVLVQQYGLQQAQSQLQQAQAQVTDQQAQIDDLRQHAAQGSGGGSFLSHIFGSSSQQGSAPTQPYQPVSNPSYPYGAPGSGGPVYPQQGYPQQGYPSQAYPPAYAQPGGYAPSGGGGFLRGALQTAAGVAAGEMAFASMESLFHGFGGGSGSGFGGGGFGGGRPEEVINNYYGESGEHHAEHSADSFGEAGSHDAGSHNDGFGNDTASDRFGGSGQANRDDFADTQGNDSNDAGDSNSGDFDSDDSSFDSGDSGGDDQS